MKKLEDYPADWKIGPIEQDSLGTGRWIEAPATEDDLRMAVDAYNRGMVAIDPAAPSAMTVKDLSREFLEFRCLREQTPGTWIRRFRQDLSQQIDNPEKLPYPTGLGASEALAIDCERITRQNLSRLRSAAGEPPPTMFEATTKLAEDCLAIPPTPPPPKPAPVVADSRTEGFVEPSRYKGTKGYTDNPDKLPFPQRREFEAKLVDHTIQVLESWSPGVKKLAHLLTKVHQDHSRAQRSLQDFAEGLTKHCTEILEKHTDIPDRRLPEIVKMLLSHISKDLGPVAKWLRKVPIPPELVLEISREAAGLTGVQVERTGTYKTKGEQSTAEQVEVAPIVPDENEDPELIRQAQELAIFEHHSGVQLEKE